MSDDLQVKGGVVGASAPTAPTALSSADADQAASRLAPHGLQSTGAPFQGRVQPWMMECFGAAISRDMTERCDRFIEEAFELVQSLGYDAERIAALTRYTYSRPAGEPSQEVGGVMVTLAALCLAADLDMHAAGETELARIWTKVPQIRAKQAAKPVGSALPMHVPASVDTHAKRGDAAQTAAPSPMSGAVASAQPTTDAQPLAPPPPSNEPEHD